MRKKKGRVERRGKEGQREIEREKTHKQGEEDRREGGREREREVVSEWHVRQPRLMLKTKKNPTRYSIEKRHMSAPGKDCSAANASSPLMKN